MSDADVFHDGEHEAHRRYGDPRLTKGLAANIRDQMTPELIRYLMQQPFFFLATANNKGDCDCSFRGRQHNRPHDPEPLLLGVNSKILVFPDYAGNGFFNSIGNMLTNPKVGLLFVDFATAMRVRINGRATIDHDLGEYQDSWPTAERMITVEVDQVYPNCRARIPRLTATG